MNIDEILETEAATAEGHRDGKPSAGIRPTRRAGTGNPAVLSVRLSKEQYQQLVQRASDAGLPTSAFARDIILAALGDTDTDRIGVKLEEVLRRTLSPQLFAG